MVDRIKLIEEAMKEYRAEWELTNPKPERGEIQKMDFLQFGLFSPVAVIGPLVSAFRTYAILYENAVGGASFWGRTEARLGTLFFELGAIAYQVIRLRRKAQREGKLPEVTDFWIWVGLVATVGAVTTSNLVKVAFSTLTTAGFEPYPWIAPGAISLFMGVGVPITSLVSGEIIGRAVIEIQAAIKKIQQDHEERVAAWNKSFVNSWNRRKGKDFLEEYIAKATGVPIKPRMVKPKRVSAPKEESSKTPEERRKEIIQYCQEHDPEQRGLKRNQILRAVMPSSYNPETRRWSSTAYKDIETLIEEDQLEPKNSRRVTWKDTQKEE